MNKISVIVPAYNLKEYICRCIDSILRQTHTDLEIIIVDDGSVDGTDAVADELAKRDDRISVIHSEHRGALQARLRGVRTATGDWLGFVDGDDTIEPQMYEGLLENALTYHADISHCGYEIVYADGSTSKRYDTGEVCMQNPLDVLRAFADDSRIEWWSLCNKIYERKLFTERVFGMLSELSLGSNEDLLMNYLLVKDSVKLIYEDRCWYRYIQRAGSSSSIDSTQKRLDRIMIRRMLRDWAPGELYELHQSTYMRMCVSEYTYLYRRNEDEKVLNKIRDLLERERDSIGLLDAKMAVMADLIINCDDAYKAAVSNIEHNSQRLVDA